MKSFPSIEDLRQRARRNVPKMFFEYADSGSYTQDTLRANRADLERIKLRQRVLVDVDRRSTETTILGQQTPLPFALAPIGL
ncbi:MAG: alpha-hydroxy-acid oxidizing protein, partial [Rhizobiales bacterium]|nr:alpha-hydroxy-acid oxidizing protein [Hyphomicrobiales bacterium]